MKEKILHVSLSCILIVISFFLGNSFGEKYSQEQTDKINSEQMRVDLSLTGKTLDIKKDNKNISIYLNGDLVIDKK